jgi:glycosyltransferase involved in cell wall biosynthesis
MVGFIYHRCDQLLVQSRAFIPNVEKYAGIRTKIRYFPGWAEAIFQVNLNELDSAPEMVPFKDSFNIVFAGNIGESQDFPAILDAAEALTDRPEVRWIILGDGRAANWVRSEILQRGLENRVFLLGRYPIERMPSFFKAADALLVSLRPEPIFAKTIPGKVQSYLAAGVPLLVMLDGEGSRVIEEAKAGLVCAAGRGDELADRVRLLTGMTEGDRHAMGERGRDYCRRHFDRATLISTLETWMAEYCTSGERA